MKTKKVLKFSKETVFVLDNTAKKSSNDGNDNLKSGTTRPPICWLAD